MQSPASGEPAASEPLSLGVQGNDPLHRLSQGIEQFIRIDPKIILEKIMHSLGAVSAPVFTVVECGDAGVKFSIKLDVSSFTSVHGESIMFSVVEGEVSQNYSLAKASAVKMALKRLETNHRIAIVDFSSRIAKKFKSYNTLDLLKDALRALEIVLVQWELALGSCENFGAKLQEKEYSDNLFGPCTPQGRVYGFLSDSLADVHSSLHLRSKDLRSELNQTKGYLVSCENKLAEKRDILARSRPFDEVTLPSTFLLEYVLGFYGLDDADYVSRPKPDGLVKTSVLFEFPHMPNFKYGGKLSIAGLGYTSSEAREEAAFEALMYIEEHFKTTVIDLNYSQRDKALKQQKKIVTKLSNILELADAVKLMFGELINAIESQRRSFSLDTNLFFAAHTGQADAYHFCFNGLTETDQYAVNCYGACAEQFDLLNQLTWKMIVLKSNLHM